MENEKVTPSPRRKFLGTIAAGAAALGLLSFKTPFDLQKAALTIKDNAATDPKDPMAADAWFKNVKGTHRIVYDVPHPNEIMPFAWSRVFLLTNAATGSKESDCGVVVVLRHSAIGYAMKSSLWEKYNFGEVFKADDPKTKKPSTRNPFAEPQKGDFVLPGVGEVQIGINQLQASGVMFCVCDAALTVYSAALAKGMNLDEKALKKEWTDGLLPGIQVVPSGVWAVGRAQEHKCAYCFAG